MVKRGKMPELLLKETGVYFDGSHLRLGDSMDQWRKVLKGAPRCSEERPVPVLCVWDTLGVVVGTQGGTEVSVTQVQVHISLEEEDPLQALVTHKPDGTPAAPRVDWSPKQAFTGYLELDGFGIDAASKFWEIRSGVKPERNLSCGLRGCTVAQGILGKHMSLFLEPEDGRESGIVHVLSLTSRRRTGAPAL